MPRFTGRNYTSFRGLNLKETNGALRFETPLTTPTTTLGDRLIYVNSSNELIFDNGTTTAVLGAASASATHSLNDAYDDGRTITVDAGPVILAGANQDTATFNITADAPSAGPAILIANSGSGNDVTGTAGWSVTAAGLGTFATNSVVSGVLQLGTGSADGTIQSNGNFNLIMQTGNGTTAILEIIDGANGDFDITLNGTGAVNINGTTAANDSLVVAAGDVAISDGSLTIIDGDAANTVTVTNNTHSTTSSSTGGIVEFRSTSLDTGALLNLEVTEGTLGGGFYLRAYDVSDGAAVFTLGEDGAIIIRGNATSDVFTITNGDVSIADGSITLVDADQATALSITADSVTSADTIFVSSDGLTSGSLMNLVSTGTLVTTGSMLEITADSATTSGAGGAGRGLVTVSGDALTTGIVMTLSSSADAGTSSQLLNLDHTVTALTGTKSGQLIDVVSSRTQTANNTVSDDYDTLSILRTAVNNASSGTLNSTGSAFYILTTSTQSQGTLADTTNAIEIDMQGGAEAQGTGLEITHTGTTVGRAIEIIASQTDRDGVIQVTANSVNTGNVMVIDANALTTGGLLELSTSGTITTTGDVLSIVANSATTSTGLLRISGTSLTNGSALEIIGSGSGAFLTAGNLVDISMGTATVGTGLLVIGTGTYVDNGVGVVNFVNDSATSGDILVVSGTALSTGNAILATGGGTAITSGGQVIDVVMGGATDGAGIRIVTTGAYAGTVGVLEVTADSSTTAGDIVVISATSKSSGGSLLNLEATGGTLTTGDYITCRDSSLDVFAVRRNGHLSGRQTTRPTIALTTANGMSSPLITSGSTDTSGEITSSGASLAGDSVLTITFEEAYAVAPRVFIQPSNEAASQSADNATTGAYISATTTTTFVVTIPGSAGTSASWDYFCFESGVA